MEATKVMVVEDEGLVARDIKSKLEGFGYQVPAISHSGKRAVANALEHKPHLVLMDINLKGEMDGIETARQIHACMDIPIVFLTAYSDEDTLSRAKIQEPYGYLIKPFDNRELHVAIEIALYKFRMERALMEKTRQMDVTLKSIGDGVIATDAMGKVFFINPVAEGMTGCPKKEALGQDLLDVVKLKERTTGAMRPFPVHQLIHQGGKYQHEGLNLIAQDARETPIESNANIIRDEHGQALGVVLAFRDITDRIRYEQRMLHNALYDALTELPNRNLFLDRLTHAIRRVKRGEMNSFAVLFLDLDRFKVVNDSLGHQSGDRLIVEMARRIKSCVREIDTVCRFSGDEFVVLLDRDTQLTGVTHIAARIQKAIANPMILNERSVVTTACVGVALSDPRYQRPEEMLRDADAALYRAKSLGSGRCIIFDQHMHESAIEILEWEAGLREALQNDSFQIHYQPIIDLEKRQVVALEALLRWEFGKKGFISPAKFIPIAEETGLIIPIGAWVLRQVCRQMQLWQEQGIEPLRVGVNLSAKEFQLPGLPGLIQSILTECKVPPHQLDLEITERVAMDNIDLTINTLRHLRQVGVRISIDDFGTGYSSLAYLKRFPINTLKIDRSFIADLETNPDDQSIAKAIIGLAQNLELEVLAEGIETEGQAAFLKTANCHLGQGYHFGKPMAAELVTPNLPRVHPRSQEN